MRHLCDASHFIPQNTNMASTSSLSIPPFPSPLASLRKGEGRVAGKDWEDSLHRGLDPRGHPLIAIHIVIQKVVCPRRLSPGGPIHGTERFEDSRAFPFDLGRGTACDILPTGNPGGEAPIQRENAHVPPPLNRRWHDPAGAFPLYSPLFFPPPSFFTYPSGEK